MAYQITKSKRVSPDKRLCQIYIDSADELGSIPEAITNSFSVGSVAYTPTFDVYTLTGKGWADADGKAVKF